MDTDDTHTAFAGHFRIASGPLADVALAVARHAAEPSNPANPDPGPLLVFSDATGRQVDLDLRGTEGEVLARYGPASAPRGRGRPRLGVVAREVTLLPEHWDWLAAQPGGASVALRKLVHDARRAGSDRDVRRQARERAYAFMSAIGGDLPGFEEASRALFAGDATGLELRMASWPPDVRGHVLQLAALR